MIRLKNVSPKFDKEAKGVELKIKTTEHPMTNTREWTEIPTDRTGKPDAMAERTFNQDLKSSLTEVTIKPDEVIEFGGKGTKYNEEMGEYVYMQYGSRLPDMEDIKQISPNNWIVEVDEKGEEVRGPGSLFEKYRSPR